MEMAMNKSSPNKSKLEKPELKRNRSMILLFGSDF